MSACDEAASLRAANAKLQAENERLKELISALTPRGGVEECKSFLAEAAERYKETLSKFRYCKECMPVSCKCDKV